MIILTHKTTNPYSENRTYWFQCLQLDLIANYQETYEMPDYIYYVVAKLQLLRFEMEVTSESVLLLLIQMLVLSTPIQSSNYVKSNNFSLHNCPGSCLTLDEYINNSMRYFTTGSAFVFLPGNHSQQNALNISNISGMIWRGNDSRSNDAIILSSGSLHCYNVTDFTIEGLKFVRLTNVPVLAFTRSAILLFSLDFQSNTGKIMATAERAVQLNHSNITIINTSFEGIRGGAVMATDNSTLTLIDTAFIGNEAPPKGHKNSGGAIYCANSIINMTGKNFLNENRANYKGGAVNIRNGSLIITGIANFSENEAKDGGALYLSESHALINGTDINFIKNVAVNGGGLYVKTGKMAKTNIFISANFIENFGPVSAIILQYGIVTFRNINIKYNENVALLIQRSQVEFRGTNSLSKNNGINSTHITRILYITDSTVTFNGNTMIKDNIIQKGVIGAIKSKILFNGSTNFSNNQGGIISRDSSMEFSGNTLFYNNSALTNGGAISSQNGTLTFSGSTSFISNKAQIDGGALYALKTEVAFHDAVNFSSNAAQSGGAMYLTSGATLFLASILNVSHNNATDYGGAIFHRDIVIPIQCNKRINEENGPMEFPNCFLQFDSRTQVAMYSYFNSAGKGGNFLYGGLLDMCWFKRDYKGDSSPYDYLMSKGYIQTLSQDDTSSTEEIESKPLQLCFCYNNSFYHDFDCNMKSTKIQRGQELNVSLVAIGQGRSIIPTDITALGKNIRFRHNQTLQITSQQCSSLQYSLYSNSDHGELELYPNGPCRDTGLAKAVVNVIFLPCPDGFRQRDEECVCDKRLEKYGVQCIIRKENNFIKRKETDTFWMSMLKSANDSYLGLILYHSCPADYCTSDTVDIPLDNLDTQCASHRTGVLCGQCSDNYSLKLGSSRCAQCSNRYLGLLIPFALAGIVLIGFLSVFRLTVAYGMINSLILYANIVQVNKRQFFPTDAVNVLTVFIAWLNLDLGIETCFFNGLDAYIQTWLQFAFPFYIWILIGLIILTSRYSMTVSKLIGTNPIAVLATLLLMSYSRILQVAIDVYTFARLDFPDEKKFAWWKDGNIPYLYQKHLLLVIFTSLLIIFFFLPYTLLLLLGPCLYRIPEGKCSRWLNRIKPLLDSYYAPYKENTRYWTGFLLLVRCALYIAVTFSRSRDDHYNSFAAIIITFSGILSINWITGKIYNKTCISLIEGSTYLNLILLSVLSQKGTRLATVYALVGIVFVTMIGIILYQFHHLYFKKVTDWMRKKISHIYRRKSINFMNRKEMGNDNVISPTISPQNVSQTVIELREPLLEN